MKVPALVSIAALLAGIVAHAEVPAPGPLEAKLQRELLAPCCYRETLLPETMDHHMSDAAIAMRKEIHELIGSGESERQIIEWYKSRYGARILAEPEGAAWWTVTLVPLIALAGGLAMLVRIVGRWRAAFFLSPNR